MKPVALVSLCGIRPLFEHLRGVDVDTDIAEGLWKTTREEAQIHNIAEVCVRAMGKPFEGGNIFVNAAFFHFQFL